MLDGDVTARYRSVRYDAVPKAIQIATAMHQTIAAYGRAIRILPPLENARNQRVNNI
jgi:hypothetical protein